MLDFLAPQVGLEPTTLRLTAECSAIELLRSDQAGNFVTVIDFTANSMPGVKSEFVPYEFPRKSPCKSLITASAARLPEASAPWIEAVSR